MRFTEGVWYGREDVEIVSAQEVGKLDFEGLERPYYPSLSTAPPALRSTESSSPSRSGTKELKAVFHTRPVKNRGDTLNKPTLSATFHSPAPGIIGVEVAHFKAKPAQSEPRVRLFPSEGEAGAEARSKEDDNSRIVFGPSSGSTGKQPGSVSLFSSSDDNGSQVELDLQPGSFGIRFFGQSDPSESNKKKKKLLTEIRADSLSWILDKQSSPKDAVRENAVTTISDPYHRELDRGRKGYMKVALNLGVGEKVSHAFKFLRSLAFWSGWDWSERDGLIVEMGHGGSYGRVGFCRSMGWENGSGRSSRMDRRSSFPTRMGGRAALRVSWSFSVHSILT
jgi:hypothetical protein